jgi:hypothetical protein
MQGFNAPSFAYPSEYGSSRCAAWDAGLAPFCAAATGASARVNLARRLMRDVRYISPAGLAC